MLEQIRQDGYGEHVSQIQAALRGILPVLGYTPDECEAVVRDHAQLGRNWLLVTQTPGDNTVYCVLTKHERGWTLHSLFPSRWPDRYPAIRAALAEIQEAFVRETSPGSVLHFGLNEDVPTHQFYFAALLSELGFVLKPRISMAVDLHAMTQILLPTLPPELREAPFQAERLGDFARFFAMAFTGLEGERPLAEWEHELAQQAAEPDAVASWTSLEAGGEIVGACYGRAHGETAAIYELAVLPSHYGRGLGKYLLSRCAWRLQAYGEPPCTRCALWTYRTLDRALALYHRMGFRRQQLWTEAIFRRPP